MSAFSAVIGSSARRRAAARWWRRMAVIFPTFLTAAEGPSVVGAAGELGVSPSGDGECLGFGDFWEELVEQNAEEPRAI